MIRPILNTEPPDSPVTTDEVVVLCAADENYVRSLSVTLRSAAEKLRHGCRLRVFLIDGGISDTSWSKLKLSTNDVPIQFEVVHPDLALVADFSTSHHITHTAYFRLLAADWLPQEVEKAIYLDADLLVEDDLMQLWEVDINDDYCLAVPDIACPHIDARAAGYNYKKSSPYLATLSPIRNYRELGLDGAAPYFNSGIMVLNLRRWRAEDVTRRLLSCLRENQKHVWCWDQYALNVVFAGNWGQLPLRWNQGAHAFEFPNCEHAPYDQQQFREMVENPAVIHFTTQWKPWDHVSDHPLRHLFFEALDETAWHGWRPQKPAFDLGRWWQGRAVQWTKHCTITYRKLAAWWVEQ